MEVEKGGKMRIRGRVAELANGEWAGVYVLVSRGIKVQTLSVGGLKEGVGVEARQKREGGGGGRGGREGGGKRGCTKEQTREAGKPLPVWLIFKGKVGVTFVAESRIRVKERREGMVQREEMRSHRKRESVISCADSVGSGSLVLPSSVLTSLASARGAPASSISSRA